MKYEEQIKKKENISFFRMEYFLYVLKKVALLIKEWNSMDEERM